MPHGDTVHNVVKRLDGKQLEKLKQAIVRTLLKRKVFHNSRYRKSEWSLSLNTSAKNHAVSA